MTHIEIHDGIANRRIRIPDLPEPIRIDVGDGLSPRVVVSDQVEVERLADQFAPLVPGSANPE